MLYYTYIQVGAPCNPCALDIRWHTVNVTINAIGHVKIARLGRESIIFGGDGVSWSLVNNDCYQRQMEREEKGRTRERDKKPWNLFHSFVCLPFAVRIDGTTTKTELKYYVNSRTWLVSLFRFRFYFFYFLGFVGRWLAGFIFFSPFLWNSEYNGMHSMATATNTMV